VGVDALGLGNLLLQQELLNPLTKPVKGAVEKRLQIFLFETSVKLKRDVNYRTRVATKHQ
jgi:hypothetical protein